MNPATDAPGTSFAEEVSQLIAAKAEAVHAASRPGASPSKGLSLLAQIEHARDGFAGALAARAALEGALVSDRRGAPTLLDGATTTQDFRTVVLVLTATREAVACFAGQAAIDAVDSVRRLALRRV